MKQTLLLFVLFAAGCARAQQATVFTVNGNAVRGYDPVAFFRESKAVKGSDSLQFKWNSATWLFASRADMDAFKANPEKYAPQYGGYCAYGTAMGHKAPTETDTWTIVNGKLYFNYNSKVKEQWMKNRDTLIMKADQEWPQLKNGK